jgi:hypothetical protein
MNTLWESLPRMYDSQSAVLIRGAAPGDPWLLIE